MSNIHLNDTSDMILATHVYRMTTLLDQTMTLLSDLEDCDVSTYYPMYEEIIFNTNTAHALAHTCLFHLFQRTSQNNQNSSQNTDTGGDPF